jgi:hypothetical protein
MMNNPRWATRGGDGHDFPGLIDQHVPGVAAAIDDVVRKI